MVGTKRAFSFQSLVRSAWPGWARGGRRTVVVWVSALTACTAPLLALEYRTHFMGSQRELVHALSPAIAEHPLRVEFSGCSLLRAGSSCEREADDIPLVVWIDKAEVNGIGFELDGVPVATGAALPVQGGRRFELRPAMDAHELDLTLHGRKVWRLALRVAVPYAWQERANRARRAGHFSEARAAANEGLFSSDLQERGRARAMSARIALGLGDYAPAARTLSETGKEAWLQGRISDAVSDALALAFVQTQLLYEFESAGATLKRAEQYAQEDPVGRADLPYYAGVLASLRGEPWVARSRYLEARAAAERLQLRSSVRDATVQLAKVDIELGRLTEALTALKHLLDDGENDPPCVLGPLSTNLAWAEMRAIQQAHAVPQVDEHLRLALKRNESCGVALIERMDRINLGLRAIELGDLKGARAQEQALARLPRSGGAALKLWEHELEGQIALLGGDPARALAAFSRQTALADALHDGDGQQRARVGKGTALETLGKFELALQTYAEANEALIKASSSVPLGVPRDGFSGAHDGAAADLVEAFVRRGRLGEGLAVALRTYQQSFAAAAAARPAGDDVALGRYLDERARIDREAERDWELSAEELAIVARDRGQRLERALAGLDARNRALEEVSASGRTELKEQLTSVAGELSFLIFPEHKYWRTFAKTSGTLSVASLLAPSSPVAEAAWLDSFGTELQSAQRIKILPYGAAHAVDWAGTSWHGRRLIEDHDVAYSLGLGKVATAGAFSLRALVVSDPTSELPNARRDANDVVERFRTSSYVALSGPRARRETVLAELGRAEFFYYSGHGQPAGLLGTSGLVLAEGAILSPSDILSLKQVPRQIVLAACEAGTSESEPMGGGWSLAHAFLLAGAEQVIAPVTSVDDASAARVMHAVVGEPFDSHAIDLVVALSRVQRQFVDREARTAQSFRVFVR